MISQLDLAVQELEKGNVVAMPTETVYGLAASIDNHEGLKKIFSTKQRPFFDPLIVHVCSKDMARNLTTDWSPLVDFLAEHFWPGPLTMVLPKSTAVDSLITSGLETVGIRMPSHSVALSLIEKLGRPVAAPSANRFGKTSPTTAEHVKSEFPNESFLILDGGASLIGIESTVLLVKHFNNEYELSILREGHVSRTELEQSLKNKKWSFSFIDTVSKKESPGHMKHHYMPSMPLLLLQNHGLSDQEICDRAQLQIAQLPSQVEGVEILRPQSMKRFVEMHLPENSALAARELYSMLRKMSDNDDVDFILFRLRSIHFTESWKAIMDRLTKAASLIL